MLLEIGLFFWALLFVVAMVRLVRAWTLLESDGNKGLLLLLLMLLLPILGPIIVLLYIPKDLDAYHQRIRICRRR